MSISRVNYSDTLRKLTDTVNALVDNYSTLQERLNNYGILFDLIVGIDCGLFTDTVGTGADIDCGLFTDTVGTGADIDCGLFTDSNNEFDLDGGAF